MISIPSTLPYLPVRMSASIPASTAESRPTARGLAEGHCLVGQLSCAQTAEVELPNEMVTSNRTAKRMHASPVRCRSWKRCDLEFPPAKVFHEHAAENRPLQEGTSA